VVKMCVTMMNPKRHERILDPACGPGGFLIHSLHWVAEREHDPLDPRRKADYSTDRLFATDYDARLVRVARALMLIAGGGRTNVYRVNSLDRREWTGRSDGLMSAVADESFDVVLTNPPFAGTIRAPEVLGDYDLAYQGDPATHKRSNAMTRDVLFIERCIRFLKPGGRMAIVLPQGNLNNVRAEYLRSWLRAHARILAVVGLSENTFKRFTNTKTSVLFLRKWRSTAERTDDYDIFMAVNRKPAKDSSGNKLVDHDLDDIAGAFVEWARSEGLDFWS
jgi:type I restriction enzyme M protein